MTIILSCGHECDVREHGIGIHEKSHARDQSRCASYSHYCHRCYVDAVSKRPDSVLFDEIEVNEYLKERD